MKRFFLIVALIAVALYGCKKTPDPGPGDDILARDGLYQLMDYIYLWKNNIPNGIVKADYDNPADLLEAMRYKDKDKWSFVADYQDFIASMSGEFVGHGISMALDTNDVVRIAMIYENSDLWADGVRRGWIVKKINNTAIAPIFIAKDGAAYNALMGLSEAGITNTFLFEDPDGAEVSLTSTKASFTVNTVLADTVFDIEGQKIAYLCFESFLEPSEGELNTAFADFTAKGATDLIIDLRYNGGGYMNVANQLASLCMNKADTTKVCYNLKYNAYVAADWNETYKFTPTDNPLGLDRVVFITTRSSASASEVVINSLKPYINVCIVGDTTHGKPCGMNLFGFPFDANTETDMTYVFAPISFEYTNSLNYGGFYAGMVPDILATDDIMHDFGDTEEHSLKAALAFLTITKSASESPFHKTKVFHENRERPSDLFLSSPKAFKK